MPYTHKLDLKGDERCEEVSLAGVSLSEKEVKNFLAIGTHTRAEGLICLRLVGDVGGQGGREVVFACMCVRLSLYEYVWCGGGYEFVLEAKGWVGRGGGGGEGGRMLR